MSAVRGKEVTAKEKNGMLHNLCTARFFCKNSKHGGSRKLFSTGNRRSRSNINKKLQKKHKRAAAVKGNLKTVSKITEKMCQTEKAEDKRVPELLIIAKN